MSARAIPRRPRSGRRLRVVARQWAGAAVILLALFVAALAIRTLVVMPRTIPSESMMPALVPGDYVAVAKWPYGWSRYSLPVVPSWPRGRLFGRMPERGDIVVFRAPGQRSDYVKRVIGLPGDTVAMRDGRVILNGREVTSVRTADFVAPAGADGCHAIAPSPYGRVPDGQGGTACRLPAWRETLPGGRGYTVIDQGTTMQDDMPALTVPPGRLFMLGDNRDLSEDSRFPVAAGGIGLVPAENIEGRAGPILVATGRGWRAILPWSAQ